MGADLDAGASTSWNAHAYSFGCPGRAAAVRVKSIFKNHGCTTVMSKTQLANFENGRAQFFADTTLRIDVK
jgi:hypothetical protein